MSTKPLDHTRHLCDDLVLQVFDSDELGVELFCWLEHVPAERGSWSDGLQMDPDYPAVWTLMHVYLPCSDVDIAPVLSTAVVDELEARAAIREEAAVITTTFINPPIPLRLFDWSAVDGNYEEGGPVGYGETEEAAVNNLKHILKEMTNADLGTT